MSVMVVTSLGDIVVDLHTDRCPLTTKNFLKLCKMKYFNGCLFHEVRKDFTAQTGDPTGKGTGGDSIYKFLYGDQARFFGDEIHPDLKHSKTGTVAMASGGENLNASQFYFTLRDDLDYLDGKHTVFGEVAEGLDTLTRINEAYVDDKGRPYKNIRIKHTYILDDPFDDPPQLAELIPDASPEGKPRDEVDDDVRLEDDWVPMDEQLGPTELEEVLRSKQAHSSAVVLESIGDIPDAEIKPPENVLFVCKLNPVTEDEDLHTIFSRFGTVVSADIIRDFKTGDSLCYAFIEFETNEACEQAYFKMDNALIDDRRIHVDFSQSVSKLWSQFRRKEHQKDNGKGCFKCGAFDHIAKDCTEGSAKMPPPKFTIKDHDQQRGGHANSSYEMVFDENAPLNTERGKRSSERESEDQKGKERMEHMGDMKRRDGEKRDTRLDEDGEGERRRDYREEDRKKGREGRTRDEDYHGERGKGSSKRHGGGYRGGRGEGDYRHEERRDERGYRKTEGHGDRRSDRDYRRGGHDSYEVGRDSRNRSGDDRDSRKRSANDRPDGDSRKRSTTDRDYSRKLSTEDDSRRRSSDRDYSRKSSTDDDSRKRSSTDRDDYRKLSTDDDSRKRSTDRDDYRKLSTDDDRRSDRRHRDGR